MKNVKTLAVLTIALLLGGWGCSNQENAQVTPQQDAETATTSTAVISTTTAKAPVKKPAVPATAVKGVKYEEALEKYRENGLMQFVDCHGIPGTFTFKKGYTFMIDNRDAKARTIVVQGIAHRLEAYGYKLISAQKVGESFVTCDGGGAGTLKIQA